MISDVKEVTSINHGTTSLELVSHLTRTILTPLEMEIVELAVMMNHGNTSKPLVTIASLMNKASRKIFKPMDQLRLDSMFMLIS